MYADDEEALELDGEYVDAAAEVFSMLADATRIRIVLALGDEELSVSQLAGLLRKQPATVSQHLAKLRLARMVSTRKDGTRVFYRLANKHARTLVAESIFQAEHALEDVPPHHRDTAIPAPRERAPGDA
ncbi:ArsR/SmtB family transcription factor [Microbacterium sp. MAHUQ-60]|uniref:ArsR/SmtB family transcription factor n=1 Tax=unclassified Microbacterium TaxID=2609290 RepID=UPI003608824C